MNIIRTSLQFLAGKKTYIVGGLMIALGLLTDDKQLVMEGLAVMTLRAGISKSGQLGEQLSGQDSTQSPSKNKR